jgi:hypothetical protein
VTWIPEGYFVGSPQMIERTLRQFTLHEALYPEEFFPRDNPNPQKVAEALSGQFSRDTDIVSASFSDSEGERPKQISAGTEKGVK